MQDETIKQEAAPRGQRRRRELYLAHVYPTSRERLGPLRYARVNDGVKVGREPGAQGFTIGDGTVSRSHFEVLPDASGWLLRDLDSSNGTRVNGELVQEARLFDQDVVRAGNSIFVATASQPLELGWLEQAGIVACSGHMALAADAVRSTLDDDNNVLLLGETGTGKELFAKLIHKAGKRKGRFVPVNCAAIPEQLMEATLFGAVKGAFTGADEDRPGLLREAEGGTLLLDEIGELSVFMQVKLLRVLEERKARPVGAAKADSFDVKIIAATNRLEDIQDPQGDFRQDLLGRMEDLVIYLPPLRQRREEIVLLMNRLLPEFQRNSHYDASFVEAVVLHEWPRNVRQLLKTVQQVLRNGLKSGAITSDTLYHYLGGWPGGVRPSRDVSDAAVTHIGLPRRLATDFDPKSRRSAPPKEEFVAAWRELEHNVSAMARHFDCDRKQVYRWLDAFELDRS